MLSPFTGCFVVVFYDPSLLFFIPQSANKNTEYATWELTAAVSFGRLINKS